MECVYYHGLIVIESLCELLCSMACFCPIAICFMPFALCYVLNNYFVFLITLLCFFILYVLLSILCVLCFCILLCILSPHVYNRLSPICTQFYRPMPLSGNPIAVNKYHVTSYIHRVFHKTMFHIPPVLLPVLLT